VKCVLLSDAEMLGNEAKIGQVILNLLVNAAQAIEAAGGMGHQIAIEMRRPQRGDVIIVQVSDTGEGIPEEIIGRIFDPFFTTKPVGVGTGLGLAICKDTIESMGGRIEVRSAPGAGTTFTLRLPVKKPAESKPVEGVAPAVTSSNPTGKICLEQPRKPSILIVEDETALASALQLMLKKQYMVNVLGNGLEAYERLKEGPLPELILCDLMMPGMTGMELYGKLRGSRPECEKHFVFMTGGAFTEAARTFLAGVPCPQLSKPFDRSTLLKVLEETASSGSAAPSH
jgi:CheY-like chemotaxis protein/anti-sigma regulatory factor (Ser/Thr protein kinase)